jgi:hypothetical protein
MLSARLLPPSARVKRHQRGVAGAAADVVGVELFAGRADVVDDDAVPARLHLRIDRAGEVDVAEHLQLPGVTPGRLVDLVDRAARDVAGIVDEDVDIGGFLDEPCDVLALRRSTTWAVAPIWCAERSRSARPSTARRCGRPA